jgi:CRISPR-associated protein Cmr4
MSDNNFVKSYKLYAVTTDPVHIGTGGYTIGRVDNTIVRDPITKIPKIPGTSIAGTWRYYMALELLSWFKEEEKGEKYRSDRKSRKTQKMVVLSLDKAPDWVKSFDNNCWSCMNCAGQDEKPQESVKTQEDDHNKSSHCGRCIVCKSFGFAKNDRAEQGLLSFADMNILLFPVYTRFGTKWVTSYRVLEEAGLNSSEPQEQNDFVLSDSSCQTVKDHINLGWLFLPVKKEKLQVNLPQLSRSIDIKDLIIVPDTILSQIINSNLEVRTSVSIDPNTGAAKQGALFTSEAIPRATILYGNVSIFDRAHAGNIANKYPKIALVKDALDTSKKYYQTLGIGGMTTRGFGRMILSELMIEVIEGGKDGTETTSN